MRSKDMLKPQGPFPPETAVFFLWQLACLIYLACYLTDIDIVLILNRYLMIPTNVYAALAISAVLYYVVTKIYDVYLGPLSRIPGPKSHAASIIPTVYHMFRGDLAFHFKKLHEKYGHIVRTGPDVISVQATAQAFKDIMGFKLPGQPKPFKDQSGEGFNGPTGAASVINAEDEDVRTEGAYLRL
ncbi:Cytochrome P450 monooxygenase [Pseudocercospora fuligena]|uniref:Cytochrome P450 monooxygenase n=1 Tax=Pseudocercospora fuligena TaxID=685502 RepID=A0A8H6RJB9_9PEZI|nr:Cytochrome P450 monooxygenase [Pseudocercospora fuligena]